jgi:ATP-dependent DNA ligase
VYRPMLPIEGREPFDDPAWLFEPKWDGYRAIVWSEAGSVRLQGRRTDLTAHFPELDHLPLPTGAVLDGEIVALSGGRPDFHSLRHRRRDVRYVAFDLLAWDGREILRRPLVERRALLFQRVAPGGRLLLSEGVTGAGRQLLAAVAALGLEGMLAKRLASPYRPGERSPDWQKFVLAREATVDVVAVEEGEGHGLSALVYDGGHYRGRVYLGRVRVDPSLLRAHRLRREGRAIVFEPPLAARVRYREITPNGQFRHPVFLGFVP